MVDAISAAEFVAILKAPAALTDLLAIDPPLLVIELGAVDLTNLAEAAERSTALPVVVVGIGTSDDCNGPAAELADVIVGDDPAALARITSTMHLHPNAATALALLLRGAGRRSIGDGLVAESATYSMLQAGPEFATWRAARPKSTRAADRRAPIGIQRDGNALHITLTRPSVHNALNSDMRDALYEAMLLAVSDPSIHVVIDGQGPSFCAGGDLGEFGTRTDPASAHMIRLQRSVGGLIASISDRVEAVVHGACIGAGIELPCFARRIIARPDARFALPEVGMGLIPGAGGTVSVTRRIGRHRTAFLALSGETIGVETAFDWGLVDEVRDPSSAGPWRH